MALFDRLYDGASAAARAAALAGGLYALPVALASLAAPAPGTAPEPTVERTVSFAMPIPTAPAPEPQAAPEPGEETEAAAPAREPSAVPAPRRMVAPRRIGSGAHVPRQPQTQATAESTPKRSRPSDGGCQAEAEGVEQIDANRYAVDRDLVDYYVKNPNAAQSLARVSWARDDSGNVTGFKVRKIRCGSLLYQAGLRSGDVIHEINGHPVTTYAQALAAYTRLRNKDTLKLSITRKGQAVRMKYSLT